VGVDSILGRFRAPATLRGSTRRRPLRVVRASGQEEDTSTEDAAAVVERASKILDEIVQEFSETVPRPLPALRAASPNHTHRAAGVGGGVSFHPWSVERTRKYVSFL